MAGVVMMTNRHSGKPPDQQDIGAVTNNLPAAVANCLCSSMIRRLGIHDDTHSWQLALIICQCPPINGGRLSGGRRYWRRWRRRATGALRRALAQSR
jgi:hypothetical protein